MTVADYLIGKLGKREFGKLLDEMYTKTVKDKKNGKA